MDQYLLEKSRIVHQNPQERNYHVFYCMLAGLSKEHKDKLHLKDASHYKYLTGVSREFLTYIFFNIFFQGGSTVCEGRDDAAEFSDIKSAMKVLMMTDQEIWDILKVLAALLHMGNIKYKSTSEQNMEASSIPDLTNVERVAALFGITKQDLLKAMTTRSIHVHGETVTSAINTEQAKDVRDAFAKGVYGRLFIYIVRRVNMAIFKSEAERAKSAIGILDIFGFENFDHNTFEQFCINYANENLQQFFVKHIFKMEQEEYNKEGINWEKISFIDNQVTLDLIAQKPMSLLALVDEQSKFPKVSVLQAAARLST